LVGPHFEKWGQMSPFPQVSPPLSTLYSTHTHTHTHFYFIYVLKPLFVFTIKSYENDDHIIALTELLEDFCKLYNRIEVPNIRTIGFTKHRVPSEIGNRYNQVSFLNSVLQCLGRRSLAGGVS